MAGMRIIVTPPMAGTRTRVGKTYGVLGKLAKGTRDNPDGKLARDIGVRVRGRRGR